MYSGGPATLSIRGGTDVGMAPPIGYLQHVLGAVVRRHLGASVDVDVTRRGYFPKGGGEVTVAVTPPPTRPSFPLPGFRIERTPAVAAGGGGTSADDDASRLRLSVYVVDTQGNGAAVAAAAVNAALGASSTLARSHDPRDFSPPKTAVCGEPGAGNGGGLCKLNAS